MYAMVKSIVLFPNPFLILLVVGVLTLRRSPRFARWCLAIAVGVLIVASVPALGDALVRGLTLTTPRLEPDQYRRVDAIVVPTAGLFFDEYHHWWPKRYSLERASVGFSLGARTGKPVILSGGNPRGFGPNEAGIIEQVVGARLARRSPSRRTRAFEIIVDESPYNSATTGKTVAGLLRPGAAVLLVTSCAHYMRMSAHLRRHGLSVFIPSGPCTAPIRPYGRDLLPFGDYSKVRFVSYELFGMLWGMLRGQIGIGDLSGDDTHGG